MSAEGADDLTPDEIEALRAVAEHGRTRLAEDAGQLLEDVDAEGDDG